MSDDSATELKAGHPPAVKVGGMRITQHKVDKPEPKVEPKNEEEEGEEEQAEEPTQPKAVLSVSGAPARGDQDFPASSVKAFHEKQPKPTNEYRPIPKMNHAINQPKKQ